MKTKRLLGGAKIKTTITTLLIVFCYSFSCAQQIYLTPAQWVVEHKKAINNSAYIFEGEVIQQYRVGKTTWVCSVLQINKIYKGSPELKLGTIKMFSEQAPMMQDAGPGFGTGSTYIILGDVSDATAFKSLVTDNTFAILPTSGIQFLGKTYFDTQLYKYVQPAQCDSLTKLNHRLVPFDRPAAQWDDTKYKIVDSLYSFFKENGLTVQEQVTPSDSTMKK
jgi:hypothetical protein